MSKTSALMTPTEVSGNGSSGEGRSKERRALAEAIAQRDEVEREAQALLRARSRARDDRVAAFGALEDAEAALADAREADARELVATYVSGEPSAEASEVPAAEAALERARRRYAEVKAIADELSARKDEPGRGIPALRVTEAVKAVVRASPAVRRRAEDFRVAERAFHVYAATLSFFASRNMVPDDLKRIAPSRDATRYADPDPAWVAAIEALARDPDAVLPD